MTKIYVVQGSTGEYSDHTEWLVCAFQDQDKAKSHVEYLSMLARHAMQECETAGLNNYHWDEQPSGKMLRLADPDARIDYTGINYEVIEVELKQ